MHERYRRQRDPRAMPVSSRSLIKTDEPEESGKTVVVYIGKYTQLLIMSVACSVPAQSVTSLLSLSLFSTHYGCQLSDNRARVRSFLLESSSRLVIEHVMPAAFNDFGWKSGRVKKKMKSYMSKKSQYSGRRRRDISWRQ